MEAVLRELDVVVMRGGDYDSWDLEVRGGLFGSVRMLMGIEEHGGGKQLVRSRLWPMVPPLGMGTTLLFVILAALAAMDQAWAASAALGAGVGLLTFLMFRDCAAATASYLESFEQQENGEV